jgi:hypothetical protein
MHLARRVPRKNVKEKKMDIKKIAKQVAAARASGGGNFIRPGSGVLVVKALKCEDLYKGSTFILEAIVESSSNDPTALDASGKPILANPPGSEVGYIQQLEANEDVAFPATKRLLLDLFGEDDASLEAEAAERAKTTPGFTATDAFAEVFELACSAQQPARGMRIGYSTYQKKAKTSGKDLVLPKWTHIRMSDEEIRASRAKLDGAPAVP